MVRRFPVFKPLLMYFVVFFNEEDSGIAPLADGEQFELLDFDQWGSEESHL